MKRIIEKEIAIANKVMPDRLQAKNSIVESGLDNTRERLDIYKHLHTQRKKKKVARVGTTT